tara:strand:- start:4656 stop:5354 length:699 start_codon:yes stop_codon:yes gene_type:complete
LSPARELIRRAFAEGGDDPAAWLDNQTEFRYQTSAAMRVLHCNQAAMDLYKAPSVESLYEPDFESFVMRDSGEAILTILRSFWDGSSTAAFYGIDQLVLDGSHISVRTLAGHEETWSRVMLVETDMTSEIEANRDLERSERRHRQLLNQMPYAVWLDDMERAFEVFGQADSALTRRYQDTGLGLPLATAVVRLHSGDLMMRSRPGKGTTVIARFPPDQTMHHRSNDSRVADA